MNKDKYRAIYKPDGKTKDGYLMFYQKEIDGKLFFVMDEDPEVRYNFDIPFVDDDWVLMQFTGFNDKTTGKELYHKDIVKVLSHYDGDHFYDDQIGILEWNEDSWSILTNDNNKNFICTLWDYVHNYNGGILGNFYTNTKYKKLKESL